MVSSLATPPRRSSTSSGSPTSPNTQYNADNLRTSKGTAYGPLTFTWDVADTTPLLLQQQIVGIVTNFLYGPNGQPIDQITGTTAIYLHQDQLGSTRLLTDQAGNVTATYSYNPYGQVPTGWKTGTATTPFQYAGQYTDSETGFQYLRDRYYDPATAQFLTQDPLVDLTTAAYNYVDNNPLNDTDPLGLSKCGQWSLGGLIDCGAKAGNAAGSVAVGGTKEVAHLGIDAITDPEYLAYWGALDLNGAIHQGLGWAFGRVGCDIANVIGASLVPIQAEGLGVDAGGDWVKEHILGVPNYTVGDEGMPNAYLFGSQAGPLFQKLGINWRHNFPGIHSNGSIDCGGNYKEIAPVVWA